MKKIYAALMIIFIAGILSCKKGKEMKTDAGFKYIIYNESSGPKAKKGDYITMMMVYKNDKDSILFDSRTNGVPIRFRLEKIPFKGSYEDGLTYLSANDSATFFVPADSLYNYLYKSRGMQHVSQDQTGFTPGTFLKFEIKLLKIQTDREAEEEILMQMSAKEKKERKELFNYIHSRNIDVAPDSSGYYLIIRQKGEGPAIDSGNVVIVDYEGRFFNDSVFDGTRKAGHPYKFISGAHHVIPGWEMVMKQLHQGDKITLVLPSKLAYGEEGLHDPNTGNFLVPPFTPLVFDIDIISVEEAPAVSGK